MERTLKIYGVIVDDLFLVLTRFHLHENMSREILIEVMYLRQKCRTSFAYRCRCIYVDSNHGSDACFIFKYFFILCFC